jgi:hypothetical protein
MMVCMMIATIKCNNCAALDHHICINVLLSIILQKRKEFSEYGLWQHTASQATKAVRGAHPALNLILSSPKPVHLPFQLFYELWLYEGDGGASRTAAEFLSFGGSPHVFLYCTSGMNFSDSDSFTCDISLIFKFTCDTSEIYNINWIGIIKWKDIIMP